MKTTMLSANVAVVPETDTFPPTKKSFPTDAPPSTVRDPPEPKPAALLVSRTLMGFE